MFIAGEVSGDGHAAALIRALRAQAPDLQFFGAGGPQMQAAGMELLVDLTQHAIIGAVDAARNYWKLRRLFLSLVAAAEHRRPDAVILVDYPGFNLRFAAFMRQRGMRVIYYISPQVWAWHPGRARQIERDVNLMLTIFPFEKDWYAQHAPRLRVEFVGHPMCDRWPEPPAVARDPNLIAILPGSRHKEISHNFPLIRRTINRLPPELRFAAAAVSEETAAMLRHPRIEVTIGNAHALMQQAAAAIVASGTATLECAYFACPMVVIYHVNWLTYLLARLVINVRWLAMPNIIAGREVVPELIQEGAHPDRIAAELRSLLTDAARREAMIRNLTEIRRSLGGPGANDRAARLILRELGGG